MSSVYDIKLKDQSMKFYVHADYNDAKIYPPKFLCKHNIL